MLSIEQTLAQSSGEYHIFHYLYAIGYLYNFAEDLNFHGTFDHEIEQIKTQSS